MAGPGRSRLSGGSILPGGTRSLDAAGEEDPEARPGWARGGRGVPATAERVLAMEAPSGGGGGDLLLALAAGLSAPPPGTWQFGANHGDFLESKAGCASTALSVRRADSSSSVGTGAGVSIHRVCAQLDIVANLDQTSSSSHSDHSEMSPTEGQKENHPEEFSLLKLQTKDGQRPEWTFYPRFSSNIHTYHVGKQCLFNGVFLGNRRSLSERTVDTCLGRKKYDIDSRNGIPKLTPGDNPYMSPEQSKDFHKAGSTLPPVNFSIVPYVKKFDTFIPLEPLPQSPNLPFWVKEKANNLRNEITEVEELHKWQPAVSLANSLFASGGLKNLPEIPEKLDECRKAGL
ncbi:spermatogenesis-associated serine-rich protein 1 isoform X5 [Oryctolagus cuniculus]|uniref:spermatogenesis-associated serine-rich protein 1 isoform X5 n=1 Tax=Oryctolagus cuniculus TaxID=9986 RepID=UPI00387A50AB